MRAEDSDWHVDLDLAFLTEAVDCLHIYLNLFKVVFQWNLVQNLTLTLKLADSVSEIRRQISFVLLADHKKWNCNCFFDWTRLRLAETGEDQLRENSFEAGFKGFSRSKHFNYYISGLSFCTYISCILVIV